MGTDLALISIPKHGVNVPPLALGYLSAAVRRAGFHVEVRDLNIELFEQTLRGPWCKIWFETNVTLYRDPAFSTFVREVYDAILEKWAEELVAMRAKWLGISCFSYRSIPTLRLLVPKIRRRNPQQKIVVGGAPISFYGPELIRDNLADYAVLSEGEIALVELLKGNVSFPGIVSATRLSSAPEQIMELDHLPRPDYAGIDFTRYTPGDPGGLIALSDGYDRFGKQAGVMASRGCVRNCTFCDVEHYWPKFRWRSPENILSEMKMLWDRYGVSEIYFHDSLINGSLTQLKDLLKLLIRERSCYPFVLRGLAIIRNQPAEIYSMFEDAGFMQLQIGVESFSEKVRRDMRKGFSNELLRENLEHYAKTKMKIILLVMAGYPTETEADQLENFRWLKENVHFNENPIWRLDWGGTALILPGAPLFYEGKHKFFLDQQGDWVHFEGSKKNDMALRFQRLKEAEDEARRLGWRVGTSYAGGEVVIGDMEKGMFKTRPQDQFRPLDQATGWDAGRPIVGYQHV